MLNVPFVISDATSLTSSGYVGDDPETVLRKLIENANGDIKKAEKGIIYLDEFDKLSRKGENLSLSRDVSGEGVQQALLKMLEGSIVDVPPQGQQRKHPQMECIKVNTENILFICSGSFESIEKTIQKRQNKELNISSTIGFGSNVNLEEKEKTFNELILDVRSDDLKKFGMIPEVLGRLPVICPLIELNKKDLIRILTEPKNALCKQYKELFIQDGINLEFTDLGLEEIANLALKRKIGARALRSIMEEILIDDMFLATKNTNKKLIIDAEYVNTHTRDYKNILSKKKEVKNKDEK